MKIINLSYRDNVLNWGFEGLEFPTLTMLVGASGTGKTQILQSILNIKRIAQGESLNGIEWKMKFELEEHTYEWKGEFETQPCTLDKVEEKKNKRPVILFESLKEDTEEQIDRENDEITLKNIAKQKASASQSIIFLLREEDKRIGNIYYTGFWDIKEVKCNNNTREYQAFTKEDQKHILYNKSVSNIRLLSSDVYTKLLLLSLNDPAELEVITSKFIHIFPQVESLKIACLTEIKWKKYEILLKLKNVDRWISQQDISAGMYRCLILIAELHLCQDKSVLLIDDFESELDVNSIDELTKDICTSKREIQFIMTSRHPYIISRIPYQAWQLVTRQEGKIDAKNTSEYKIYDSRQNAFRHLIQIKD